MKHLLIVLSGPSGVGKGTLVKTLKKSFNFTESISCTTRQMRKGERDGKEYFFIDRAEFLKRIENGGFLEYSEHFNNLYGTPLDFVQNTLNTSDIVLEIEINGAMAVKKAFPEALLILIAPPSLKELKNRLKGRNTESSDDVEQRTKRAICELQNYEKYDYLVINSDINDAAQDLKTIIRAHKLKTANMKDKMNKILEDLS